MQKLTVYTDGSCVPNPGPCSWGAVLLEDGTPSVEAFAYIGIGTNNIAEITAATEGLRLTPIGSTVELVSDSDYTIKGISEWREGWEKRGWKKSDKKPVENIEQWKELFAEVDKRIVSVRWVKGHNKDRYNERADKLADEGMQRRDLAGPARTEVVIWKVSTSNDSGAVSPGPHALVAQASKVQSASDQRDQKLAKFVEIISSLDPARACELLDSALVNITAGTLLTKGARPRP